MKTVTLDFSGRFGREEIQKYLKESFCFPDYYGNNLDALFDCLTNVAEDTKIVIAGAPGAFESEPYLKAVRRVIEDAVQENSRLHL